MNADELAAAEARINATLGYDNSAYCVTVVVGTSAADVLAMFGADPERAPVPYGQVMEDEYVPTVSVRTFGDAVVAAENNGYQGSRPAVLRPASASGRAASLYCGNDGEVVLTLASDGEILFDAEVLEPPAVDAALMPYFADLDWNIDNCEACALTVVERFTGILIEGPPPAEPHLVHRLEPHLDLPPRDSTVAEPPPDSPDDPWLHSHDWNLGRRALGEDETRRLTAAVLGASTAARRRLARLAAERALRAVGLADHPDLAATLATLDSPDGPTLAPETQRMIRRGLNVSGDPVPPSYNAFTALQHAVGRNAVFACLDAMWRAVYTLRRAGSADDVRTLVEDAYGVLGVAPEAD